MRFGPGSYRVPDQYSVSYHLSRPVYCRDCGVPLHKTPSFVFCGYRCDSCDQQLLAAAQAVPVMPTVPQVAAKQGEL